MERGLRDYAVHGDYAVYGDYADQSVCVDGDYAVHADHAGYAVHAGYAGTLLGLLGLTYFGVDVLPWLLPVLTCRLPCNSKATKRPSLTVVRVAATRLKRYRCTRDCNKRQRKLQKQRTTFCNGAAYGDPPRVPRAQCFKQPEPGRTDPQSS